MSADLGNQPRNIMQAQQTPRPTHEYDRFYRESADFPEQLKFRRFGPQWFKKLYDDEEELHVMEKELNDEIAGLRRKEGCGPLTTLDYPRVLAKREGKLYGKWMRYEQKLRTHTQDICLVSNSYRLPGHSSYASTTLNKYDELFENGIFGPTNEVGGAAAYQDPTTSDFVALLGVESYDMLLDLAIKHIVWIDKRILERLRRWLRIGEGPGHVQLSALNSLLDAVVCIFVPTLFTIIIFALARVRGPMVRIAVIGIFGVIFLASARLLSGPVSRSSIFSLAGAYFAVASVFVWTTGDSACKCG